MAPEPSQPSLSDEAVSPILRVAHAERAVAWYARLGFASIDVHRFGPGMPAFVTVRRGAIQLFLSEHTGDARPDTLVYLSVRDVDPIAIEFGVEVEDAPWGREVELKDPDGNRLRIGSPLRADGEAPAPPGAPDPVSSLGEIVAAPTLPETTLTLVLRDVIGALYRGDLGTFGDRLDRDVVWVGIRPELRCDGRHEVLRRWAGALAWIRAGITRLEILGGGSAIVIGVQGIAPEDTTPDFDGQRHLVLTIADGLVTRIEGMDRRADALLAAGIRDDIWR